MITGMPPDISFAAKPTLRGELITLRPVRPADAVGLASLDAETLRLTGSHRTHRLEELERWYGSRAEHHDRLDLASVERATGAWAGEVVLNDLDSENRSCDFRILLVGRKFYGRGLGTEASRMVLAHGFNVVGLHRIELEVYAFNPRARHVYEKLGFVREGTMREALLWGGAWVDADIMAILAEERSRMAVGPSWHRLRHLEPRRCMLRARIGLLRCRRQSGRPWCGRLSAGLVASILAATAQLVHTSGAQATELVELV
jgi:RimJ/RimL family protein N-acetyltransferase